MQTVKMIDKNKQIIGLSWIGKVSPEDVQAANEQFSALMKQF
ncbi:hypothetical protein [Salipaludibacillus keqinensis]|nr:hypothetical protein [Salipaludibacillus keqinensis]